MNYNSRRVALNIVSRVGLLSREGQRSSVWHCPLLNSTAGVKEHVQGELMALSSKYLWTVRFEFHMMFCLLEWFYF